MGAKQSTQTGDTRLVSQQSGQFESASASAVLDNDSNHNALLEPPGTRSRTRSVGSVPHSGVENGHPVGVAGAQGPGFPLPIHVLPQNTQPSNSGHLPTEDGAYGSGDPVYSESSSPDGTNSHAPSRVFHAQSLPVHLLSLPGIKCPICSKFVLPDEIECHLIMCLTKPRISYNEDVLSCSAGECIICFEVMESGEHIARLPCLCIYHKSCIDKWFEVNRSCPEHPND